jgi:hypothetical protein
MDGIGGEEMAVSMKKKKSEIGSKRPLFLIPIFNTLGCNGFFYRLFTTIVSTFPANTVIQYRSSAV